VVTAPRLSSALVGKFSANIAAPRYDRAATTQGVVHLGIGAFHRAHQAAVFDDLLARGDRRWAILGASLRAPDVRDALAPQDCLYTLVERDGATERLHVIGAVRDVLVAPENPAALVAALAAPSTHIVTLTITEKGYKTDLQSGALLEHDSDVAADIASLVAPRTAPGFLVAALAVRRARGEPPTTIISCDNLPANGRKLRAAVLSLAERHDPRLAAWIAEYGAFPETMVDRIVPATTMEDIEHLAASAGYRDAAMVKTEPFSQWVIEDRFCGPRPDFEAVGVNVVPHVAPWEDAKLRLLNGAHSAMAYLGALAGYAFVAEVIADAAFATFVERLWDEAADTLDPPPELGMPRYRTELKRRFANSALAHRTHQIAIDGSQKLPQRLLAPIAVRLARGQDSPALTLAVAAWMRWQEGFREDGTAFTVDDPLAARTAPLARATDARDAVAGLLSLHQIFPTDLAASSKFATTLAAALSSLRSNGAARTVAALV